MEKVLKDALLNESESSFVSMIRGDSKFLDARDENGWSVLHLLVVYNKVEVVQQLSDILRGRDVLDGQDFDGLTPLAHAAYLGRERLVSYLLEMGASQFVRDNEGLRARDWAELSGNVLCQNVLSVHNLQQEILQIKEALKAQPEPPSSSISWSSSAVIFSILVCAVSIFLKIIK